MKKFLLPLASLAILAAPLAANAAAPCRDAHGRFTKCTGAAAVKPAAKPAVKPVTMAAAKPVAKPAPQVAKAAPKRCKINGRFASCSAPGAKPA